MLKKFFYAKIMGAVRTGTIYNEPHTHFYRRGVGYVSRFEGWDVSPFLDELKDVIDSFR